MSSTNGGVDPPDKSVNVVLNKNSSTKPEKNTRLREIDDEDDDVFEETKRVKTSLPSKVQDLQRRHSQTLLRKSLLDTNPFAILDSSEDTDDLAGKVSKNINIKQFEAVNHSIKNKRKQRIPPITITKPFKNPKEAISNIEKMIEGKVMFKILKEGYNVTVESLQAHSTLKEFLAKQKIPFYTFTTSDKKPVRLVLKGVHHTYTPEEIIDDLSTQKVEVLSVQPMFGKGKINLDMFIVNFEHGSKIAEIMKTIKHVCHQTVTWKQFIKKDVGTQCRKCQRFGHAATNCGLEYRCVKCTDRHSPGDCPLESDQPAKCVNCNDAHPASYKKCPVYTKYAEKLKKPQNKTGNNTIKQNNANIANISSKSALVKNNISYSQVIKNGKENNMNFMTNEINNLFDCSMTDLLQKIQSFVPEYKKVNDVMLKKIMIIDFLSQFT